MTVDPPLSAAEMTSLRQVGRGAWQDPIPKTHADRLVQLGLVYRVLGLRITTAGRERVGYGGNSASPKNIKS